MPVSPHLVATRASRDAKPVSPHLVAILHVTDPITGDEQYLLVDRPVLQIGSARDECGLTLGGPGVAATHCSLRWQANRWILHDRGAAAGIYVNSRRCREPTALCPGDRISIVHHLIIFTTLPSLELPHVLARLRDRPVRWTLTRPHPGEPQPAPLAPNRRRPRLFNACATLLAILGLASGISANNYLGDPTPAAITSNDHLSPEPAPPPPAEADVTTHAPPAEAAATDSPRQTPPADAPPTVYVTEPPTFELPPDAIGLGRPTDGAILHALQLPSSPEYTIRCPAHAHATTATINELMHGLARTRNRGYTGELVVGDLSRLDGGRYGPHQSHQSGRDVDLWLPILGGRYDRGCPRCGTDLCRPEPEQVDWPATWTLIQSLAERGTVEDIFLDWTLHPALAQAAHDLGVPADEIHRQIQHPIRGRSTLVKHSDGHIHHLHIRFREPSPA
jgi:murein endopeptidase